MLQFPPFIDYALRLNPFYLGVLMNFTKTITAALVCAALVASSTPSNAQAELLGGIMGAAIGGKSGNAGGAVAGAIIGVAMAVILEKLSEQEKANRQEAFKKAAQSGSASWSTHGKDGKRATYKRTKIADVNGQKCQKVTETITLADGKQGTSEENVCGLS